MYYAFILSGPFGDVIWLINIRVSGRAFLGLFAFVDDLIGHFCLQPVWPFVGFLSSDFNLLWPSGPPRPSLLEMKLETLKLI